MELRSVLIVLAALALASSGCADSGDSTPGGSGEPDAATEPEGQPEAEPGSDTSAEPSSEPSPEPSPEPEPGDIELVINEVAPSGVPADWVEIANLLETDADIGGWRLTDSNPIHVYTFPVGTTVPGGGYFLIYGSAQAQGFDFGLGDADSVALYDEQNNLVAAMSWNASHSANDANVGLIPDKTGEVTALANGTPGAPNEDNPAWECGDDHADIDELCDGLDVRAITCQHLGMGAGQAGCNDACDGWAAGTCEDMPWDVVLNEVTSKGDDLIELVNPHDDEVDISGYWLTDADDAPKNGVYTFPEGTVMAAGEVVVLQKGIHHLFGLKGEDAARLFAPDGTLVDHVGWVWGGADVSWCRQPSGTGIFGPCSMPSFGVDNL